MLKRLRKFTKHRKAMTGLETAIVLIAFVVVAAAFAFVVLNMGFYTSQKSRTVISAGLGEASSSIELDGSVIATVDVNQTDPQDTNVTGIILYIKLSVGRQPVELNTDKMVISYVNPRVSVDNVYDNSTCVITQIIGDGDAILEEGEKFKVFLNITSLVTQKDSFGLGSAQESDIYLHPHDQFRVELKPPVGSILTIERIIPASVSDVTTLD
ncbi:hypothetical protein J7K52_01050 [Candidatus Bathyarchaeota archaeon]|nr:hypothetical protein [Candidatus Bathyarchaeota archaeon]